MATGGLLRLSKKVGQQAALPKDPSLVKQKSLLDEVIEAFPIKKEEPTEQDMLDSVLDESELVSQDELDEVLGQLGAIHDKDINPQADELDSFLDDINASLEETDKIDLSKIEEIDLDSFTITENTPNSPTTLEDIANEGFFSDARPLWIDSLDERASKGIGVMAHIRGSKFLVHKEKLIHDNYVDPPLEPAKYPPIDVALQMEPKDFLAINFYTHSGDGPMNAALRTDKVDPDTDLGIAIEMTQNALDKVPSWNVNDGHLYRRINDINIKTIFDQMEIGEVYKEKGFTSTTREPMINAETGEAIEGRSPARLNYVILPKENGNGKPIEGLSNWSAAEQEVLFKHGTEFKLVARKTIKNAFDEDVTVVFVEER